MLCGISKAPFKIPHKISSHTLKCVSFIQIWPFKSTWTFLKRFQVEAIWHHFRCSKWIAISERYICIYDWFSLKSPSLRVVLNSRWSRSRGNWTYSVNITAAKCGFRWDVFDISISEYMMTSPDGNIFRVTEPLWGNPSVIGGFPSQRPVTQSFNFFLWSARTSGWANTRDADDLRRHCAHYDVTVMWSPLHNSVVTMRLTPTAKPPN